MASFFDDEAEVGTTDEEDEVEDSSKLKKKPKRAISSDEDEDEDDDEEKAREEMRGFIAVRISLTFLYQSHFYRKNREIDDLNTKIIVLTTFFSIVF